LYCVLLYFMHVVLHIVLYCCAEDALHIRDIHRENQMNARLFLMISDGIVNVMTRILIPVAGSGAVPRGPT